MKNNILTHLITLCIVTVVFVSCSKDDAIVNVPRQNAISANSDKMGPVTNGGSISGTLDPVPVTSDIAIYKDGPWSLVGQTTAENGNFLISNIPAGEYYVRINYTTSQNSTERTITVTGVIVREEQTTSLGTIQLE